MVAKLQARLRDLEAELEMEQRRGRDLLAANRKFERSLAEIRVQADEDSRVRAELTDTVQTLTIRVKTLRRQLEEAVSITTMTTFYDVTCFLV
jgi:nitrogen fixation/metabolism regulation signal transduction histidine kinase